MPATHTAGSWSIVKTDHGTFIKPGPDERRCRNAVAEVFRCHEDNEANALLIAAAPELLAALEQITAQLELVAQDDHERMAIEDARDAIAVARGQV